MPWQATLERLPAPIALVASTVGGVRRGRVVGRAAEVAFFALLSLPPTMLTILGGIGYLANALGPEATGRIRQRVFTLGGIFLTPETVTEVVRPAVDSLLREGRADIIGIGVLITLWSASRATRVLMDAVRRAYGVEETRPMIVRRAIALGVTLVGIAAAILIIPLLVAGPRIGAAIGAPFGLAEEFRALWRLLYWPVAGLVGIGLLATFYDVALPGRTPWLRDLPGAFAAAALWLLSGAALRYYAAAVIQTNSVYGSLAAPIVLLLWLHVTASAVLLGAHLNAAIEGRWPSVGRSGNGTESGD